MKKKNIFTVVALILSLVFLAFVLISCGEEKTPSNETDNGLLGTYFYEREDFSLDNLAWIEIVNNNQWKDSKGKEGTYTVSGSAVTFYLGGEEFLNGVIDNGVLEVNYITYRKEARTEEKENPNTTDTSDRATITGLKNINVEAFNIDGFNIYFEVSPETNKLDFYNNFEYKTGGTYCDFYSDSDYSAKISQIVALEDGENVFYIKVTTNEGDPRYGKSCYNKYTLTIYKKIYATITYLNEDGSFYAKEEKVLEGTVLKNGKEISRMGYTFNGWKEENATNVFDFTAPIKKDTTLYASWTANKYTVTLDAKGGKVSKNTWTVTMDEPFSFPVATDKFEHNFGGWCKWPDGDTPYTYADGKGRVPKWTTPSHMTLYAKWIPNQYKVTLNNTNPDAGTLSGGGNKDYGSEVTIKAKRNKGYVLIGLYDENETKVSTDANLTYTFTMSNKPKTFKAIWEIGVYTITYDPQDGYIALNSFSIKYGDTYSLEKPIPTEALKGYEFIYWRYDGWRRIALTGNWQDEGDSTLVAEWSPITYNITYDLAGGNVSSQNRTTYTVETPNFTLNNPIKPGYTFIGWSGTDIEGESTTVEIQKGSIGVRSYIANWVPTTCRVTFDANSGNSTHGAQDITTGDSISSAKAFPVATHSNLNMKFMGWYNSKTGGKKITDSQGNGLHIWNADNTNTTEELWFSEGEEITLYARWFDSSTKPLFTRIDAAGNEDPTGDYILFGEYPQTIKANDVEVTTEKDVNDRYYLGKDNSYYAKVSAVPYDKNCRFSNNEYINNGRVYFFKVEPVKWRILTLTNGDKNALLLCESIIANKRYNDWSEGMQNGVYANNYRESEISDWLNNELCNTMFSLEQKDKISEESVDNRASTTGYDPNQYADDNPYDSRRIFLASYCEVTEAHYGLSATSSRRRVASDYSRATGVQIESDSSAGYGRWWLRSPHYFYSDRVRFVGFEGTVDGEADVKYAVAKDIGVVPALRLKLE